MITYTFVFFVHNTRENAGVTKDLHPAIPFAMMRAVVLERGEGSRRGTSGSRRKGATTERFSLSDEEESKIPRKARGLVA